MLIGVSLHAKEALATFGAVSGSFSSDKAIHLSL